MDQVVHISGGFMLLRRVKIEITSVSRIAGVQVTEWCLVMASEL